MGSYLGIFRQTIREFGADKVPRLGAALAYYTIFSIGPLLLIAVAMAGIFLGQDAAQGKISAELGRVFGATTAKSVEQMIEAAAKPKSGTVATMIGVVMLFVGASGVFGQLKDALNTIWNVEPKKNGGVKVFLVQRFLSMAMVLGIGFLLLVTLVFDAMISAMGSYLGRYVGGESLLHVAGLLVSFGLAVALFAAIFRILPDLKIAWHDVWLGAVFTAVLFVLGKWGLGVYLGKAAIGSSYGAAGSLVVLLVWVYWSAQILFFGAEFTQVYARTLGSLQGDTSKEEAMAETERIEDRPPSVLPAPARAKGIVKVAAGGVVGMVLGAILAVVSVVALVLKSVGKVIRSSVTR